MSLLVFGEVACIFEFVYAKALGAAVVTRRVKHPDMGSSIENIVIMSAPTRMSSSITLIPNSLQRYLEARSCTVQN